MPPIKSIKVSFLTPRMEKIERKNIGDFQFLPYNIMLTSFGQLFLPCPTNSVIFELLMKLLIIDLSCAYRAAVKKTTHMFRTV